jgi:hypothetical protein
MRSVLAAPPAELLELEAVAGVGLALDGHIVAPLARVTRECDRRPLVAWHVGKSLFSGSWLSAKS